MQIKTIDDLLQKIEEERIKKNLTKRELSLMIGRCDTHYWRCFKHNNNMTIDTLIKYCTALGLKLTVS